jgi:CBS domain containing-hemolysin-like protein
MGHTQIIALVIVLLLAGFFTGIEVAFANANRLTIELKKKQGILSGKILARFIEQPARFIVISLVGMTLMLVLFCLIIDEALRPFWAKVLDSPMQLPYLRLIIEIVPATLVMLLLGVFLPRALFRARPQSFLVFFAVPVSLFYKLFYPPASLLVGVAEWILKYLFNVRIGDRRQVFNRVDMEHFMRQSQQNVVEAQELNTVLFENALTLAQIKVRECMIPRKEIEALEVNSSIRQATDYFIETKLSKIIIYETNIDNILGYIHQLDMYKEPANIRTVLHPILAVPVTMSAIDLMSRFTQERKSIAWVVDEFGGTAGIVTLEDLLEEIFGEIKDEHDTEEFVEKQIADKEFILSGRLEIDYLNEKYHFDLPEDGSETLSGFIIDHHETIPGLRERIIIDDFEFDILSVTETRIEMVKMRVLK